ncbi:MAG: hypothetical protein GX259_05390, partial [Bacteroidales bacterium]|nr:hypothetical protein [Bacteroidales bacterium]
MKKYIHKLGLAKYMPNTIRRFFIVFAFLLFNMLGFAQLTVTTGHTPDEYIDKLIGGGITYSNVTYTGHPRAIGMFSTGANPTNLGLSSGFMMATGYVNHPTKPIGSPSSNLLDVQLSPNYTDADLTAIVGGGVNNAASIEFDFIPVSDTIRFRYVFASEEYPEYVCSQFNDVFAFFLSGPNPLGGNYNKRNIARIPGTNLPVAINTVNPGVSGVHGKPANCTSLAYSSYYVDNTYGVDIIFDGFTVVLTAWAVVVPCEEYHIKLAIADVTDRRLDSGVFFEENSFYCPNYTVPIEYLGSALIGDYTVEASCPDKDVTICFSLDEPAPYNTTVNYSLSGTAQEGIDYPFFPNPIVIPQGETAFCYTFAPFADSLVEDTETIVIISNIDASCKEDTTIISILDHQPLPLEVIISNDVVLCSSDSSAEISTAIVKGIPPYSYSWDNGLSTQPSHIVQPTQTTTYTVTATDACFRDTTNSVTVFVDSAKVFVEPDTSLCYGQPVQINAITAQTNILWSNGDTTSSIVVTPPSTTTYTATVISEHGCIDSASTNVVVHPNPVISISATSGDTICADKPTTLTASSNIPNTSFEWNTGDITASITVSPDTTTTYTVTGTTNLGCSNSTDITITVSPIPVVNINVSDSIICDGDTVTLTASSDITGSSFVWSTGESTAVINVTPSITTTYKVVVTSPEGCVDSLTTTIIVNPNPI